MDKFTQIAGFVMIILTMYVAVSSAPPVGEAITKTFMTDVIAPMAIVTLAGGTVGGYITFSGGHRLADAGIVGKKALPQITRSSVTGIMRVVLFLAVLGLFLMVSGLTRQIRPLQCSISPSVTSAIKFSAW